MPTLRTAILAIGLPVVVFIGVGRLMTWASDRSDVVARLHSHAAEADRRPLNMRFSGYDDAAVLRHWKALDKQTQLAERRLGFLGVAALSLVVLVGLLLRSASTRSAAADRGRNHS